MISKNTEDNRTFNQTKGMQPCMQRVKAKHVSNIMQTISNITLVLELVTIILKELTQWDEDNTYEIQWERMSKNYIR